ncbi:MAG: AraC family transcriptional regulator [Lachnospiraceae bacterium]|nr:AraC family transcriptional regulator [Lachnospiraceae bacterium]
MISAERLPLGQSFCATGNAVCDRESVGRYVSVYFRDDEDFIRELFTEIMDFSEYGFELAATFSSAEQALSYLKAGNLVDAVLTDIRMGDMSGLELSEYLHQNAPEVEIVIISGYGEFEYAQKAIKCSVFDYLLKPTSLEDLDRLFVSLKNRLDEKKGITEEDAEENTDEYYRNIIQKVQEYVENNYSSDLSLDEIADQVGMNSAYLSRYFKQRTGQTFMDYRSRVRVNKAMGLLKDPTIKVYEVGEMVGYRSLKHFYKIFKKYTQVTPSQYREQLESGGKRNERNADG